MDSRIIQIIEAVQQILQPGESIVSVNLAQPISASHADYFVRYKAKIGQINGSATEVTNIRCVVIYFSSNTQTAAVNTASQCRDINNVVSC